MERSAESSRCTRSLQAGSSLPVGPPTERLPGAARAYLERLEALSECRSDRSAWGTRRNRSSKSEQGEAVHVSMTPMEETTPGHRRRALWAGGCVAAKQAGVTLRPPRPRTIVSTSNGTRSA